METHACKITIHMVSSVDGYIAKHDNRVSWFETSDHYEKGINEDDTHQLFKTIDCFVMGLNTYELAMKLSTLHGWPYGDTPTIVLTRRELQIFKPYIKTYSGDLVKLVKDRLAAKYKNV